jgi:hypothetical protein
MRATSAPLNVATTRPCRPTISGCAYLFVEGGFYIDADDVCVGANIGWLFDDGRLKVQPLCYDIASGTMVSPSAFLHIDAYDPDWIFYFNNNPLLRAEGIR